MPPRAAADAPPRLLIALRCLSLAALALAAGACSEGADSVGGAASAKREGPSTARWDIVDALRASRDLEFHASDGGGRAWLESAQPQPLRVGDAGRFVLVYEAGPEGIAEGGAVYLQVSPFWGWSTPQTQLPDAPGYTIVETDAAGVVLEAGAVDQQLMMIRVTQGELREGDRVHIVYGAGPAGARIDRYADADARLWFAVDGDGDGARKVLVDSPLVRVAAGPPARLVVTLPSVMRPGEAAPVCIAALDAGGSRGVEIAGELSIEISGDALELPERADLAADDGGVTSVTARAVRPGLARISVRGPLELEAESNPVLVSGDGPRVLWADLHGHSGLSDGTGTPEDYLAYARDVACLDVAALTDHDHWGVLPLAQHPENWQRIEEQTRRFHEPGRFVTLLGFEWTSWIHGHRHVLYFSDTGRVIDSVDPATESPPELWKALEGEPAITIAHHSAGGPIANNWDIPPDPRFEPVTEVVSVHGSSEAPDSPNPIYDPEPGSFVRDALDRGYRLGFVGSGDTHDGHPGMAHLTSPSGGLAAILAESATREAVERALRERRVYATSGPRILLRTALGSHRMGAIVKAPETGGLTEELFVSVLAVAPLERVDLVRSGALVDSLALDGRLDATLHRSIENLRPGEYLYVRVVQRDGGAAWSSPIFIE